MGFTRTTPDWGTKKTKVARNGYAILQESVGSVEDKIIRKWLLVGFTPISRLQRTPQKINEQIKLPPQKINIIQVQKPISFKRHRT